MPIENISTFKKTIEPVSQAQELTEITSKYPNLKHDDMSDEHNLILSELSELINDKEKDPLAALEKCRWHG